MRRWAYDDVIVDDDPERLASLDDRSRRVNVGAARLGVTTWMIVRKNDCCRSQLQCSPDHLAHMNAALVDRARPHYLVSDEVIAGVEKQYANALDRAIGEICLKIVEQAFPIAQQGPLANLAPCPMQRGGSKLGQRDRCSYVSRHSKLASGTRPQDLCESTKFLQQGDRCLGTAVRAR